MIVIVTGMHRSGTSALAGLLHQNGISMGEEKDFFPPPAPENPRGFYENIHFRRINDALVEKSGYKIKSWNPDIPPIKAGFRIRRQMNRTLRAQNGKSEHWGWKDPRNCLTLQIWLEQARKIGLLQQCRIVFIIRNPFAVAESMVRRGNTFYENALCLWRGYNLLAIRVLDTIDSNRFYCVNFEALCSQPAETAAKILRFLTMTRHSAVKTGFIEPRLTRSSKTKALDVVDRQFRNEIEALYTEFRETMNRLAASKEVQ